MAIKEEAVMFKIYLGNDLSCPGTSIDATFYVNINGRAFPDSQWTDLILSVLEMWADNMVGAYENMHTEFCLYFMDGPYYIDCIRDGIKVQISCIEERVNRTIIANCVIDFDFLVDEIIDVSYKVIQAVGKCGFNQLDTCKSLKRSLQQLIKMHGKYK